MFASVVTLLMRSAHTKGLTLADLEWLVLPALRTQQVMLAEARAKDGAITVPAGLLLWARLSPAVEKRLLSDPSPLPRLEPSEWSSGDAAWVIVTLGPNEAVSAMLNQLASGPLAGKVVKIRGLDANGQLTVRELRARASVTRHQ
jgi:hemolysin-activating ACP:hemolysin acyltransferase